MEADDASISYFSSYLRTAGLLLSYVPFPADGSFFNEEHTVADVVYAIIFAAVLSPLQRTVYISGVAVSSKAIINFILLALYLLLLAQTCTLGFRHFREIHNK